MPMYHLCWEKEIYNRTLMSVGWLRIQVDEIQTSIIVMLSLCFQSALSGKACKFSVGGTKIGCYLNANPCYYVHAYEKNYVWINL